MIDAHLVVLAPTGPARPVPLLGVLTIGSEPGAGVRLDDREVEPRAATLSPTASGWLLERHAGTVMVNGRRVRRQELAPSDLVTIGGSALAYRLGGAPSPEEPGGAHSLEVLRRLYAFTRRLTTGDAPEALTEQLLADVVELTGANRGQLVLHDGEGFLAAAARSRAIGEFAPRELQLSRTVMARLRQDRRPLLVSDSSTDRDLAHAPSVHDAGIRSLLCAPIVGPALAAQGSGAGAGGERLLGALYVSRFETPASFTQEDLDLLTIYAGQASLLLDAAEQRRLLASRAEQAEQQLATIRRSSSVIGASAAMTAVVRDLRKVARSTIAVLLLGETGTGKEVLARELHQLSPRADKPFVPVHCGAIPEALLESELFGHVRGAFTDASHSRTGRIRAADGGTLFLDEIGEMPLGQQAKLLRVLEDRYVQPVGGDVSYQVDFRLVCATNQDMESLVEAGRFRRDLYFRIATIPVRIPPLRERGDDVIELAHFFLQRHRATLGRPAAQLSASALTALRTRAWPGNVRELEAAVRRAIVLSDADLIGAESFGGAGSAAGTAAGGGGAPGSERPDAGEVSGEVSGEASGKASVVPFEQARDAFLKGYVRQVVARFDGNRAAAARALLVTPRTIFKYLDEI